MRFYGSIDVCGAAARLAPAAAVTFAIFLNTAADAQTRLTFGAPAPNEGLPLRMADDRGFFKNAGIAVQFMDFKGGGPAVQAFASGSTDFCMCSADHAIRLANRGLDARILLGLDERHTYALMTKIDSPYSDIPSMKGKRIGVTSPGSLTDNTVRWAIKRAGFQPERDFQILGAGGGAAMRAAIETGQVDAGAVVVTEIADYLQSGKFKIAVDWRTAPYAAMVVIGRQRWVDANPALAKALVHAAAKGSQLIQSDTAATIQTIKRLFPNFSDAHVLEFAEAAKRRYSQDGSVSQEAFDTTQEIVLLSDPTLKKVNKADIDLHSSLAR